MDIRDYLRVLRTRWRVIALFITLGLAAAAALVWTATPLYRATSQVFVSASAGNGDSLSGINQGGQFAESRAKSYAQIIDSPMVTDPVIRTLELTTTSRALRKKISAEAQPNTVLLDIAVKDKEREQAQRIADAVAQQFVRVVAQLETPEGATDSLVKVTVVRPAELPASPVSPRPKLDILLGLLVGAAIGVTGALLRDALDRSVTTPDQVQDVLGLPTLGMIAYDGGATKKPLIVHVDPHSPRAEAFRQLRTNLQFVDLDSPAKSIVVTSSIPQEGKSTTACNLAIALSQAGVDVILVEADLRRPRLASYLGTQEAIGLTDVLVGRTPVADVLQTWGPHGLRVLASGPRPPNPSELLGSDQMRLLLEDLEAQSDLVILDAPPLLPVTDAAVLAAISSGAILVVRSGKTTREQAGRAVEILEQVDAHIYGAVLNMLTIKDPASYGYGYIGYGYGGGGAAPELPAAPGGSATEGSGARP